MSLAQGSVDSKAEPKWLFRGWVVLATKAWETKWHPQNPSKKLGVTAHTSVVCSEEVEAGGGVPWDSHPGPSEWQIVSKNKVVASTHMRTHEDSMPTTS